MLIKIENNVPVGHPIVEDNFRLLYPEVSFPRIFSDVIVEPLGYAMYDFSQIPVFGPLQKVVETPPVKNEFGIWRQQWQVVSLIGVELTDRQSALELKRIETLWRSATATESAVISGSAIGLLTIGLLQNKPKCLAMQMWIHVLWTEYYTRKGSGSSNFDFTAFGTAPHSVPELMQELGF